TSAIRAVPGSAAATRTPTACYVSTSRSAPRSPTSHKRISTTSPQNSTTGLDKPSDGDHHHKHSTKRCVEPLNPQPFGAHKAMPGYAICRTPRRDDASPVREQKGGIAGRRPHPWVGGEGSGASP